jgi:hypothetical protein
LPARLARVDERANSHAAMEAAIRGLCADNDLRQPDEIHPHEDGGIVCLWHAEKLAVVIDPD